MPLRAVVKETAGPVRRVACEPGQGLIAAAISGVVRACGVLAVLSATGEEGLTQDRRA